MSDLRAALEELAADLEYDVSDAPAKVRAVLAAHPARSAQASSGDPVGDWSRLDESPAASAQMIQWYAPKTAAILVAAAPLMNGAE